MRQREMVNMDRQSVRHGVAGVVAATALSLLLGACTASATSLDLVIAPVINRVAGSGPGSNVWALSSFNSGPGVVFDYGAGYPPDPTHLSYDIYNDTPSAITALHLEIYGWADNTEEPWVLVTDPTYPAIFGTVPGEGGPESDIFRTIIISPDGKTIDFTDGLLLPGERFTDIVKSFSLTNPNYAAMHSSYSVPEIGAAALGSVLPLLLGSLALLERRLRRGNAPPGAVG